MQLTPTEKDLIKAIVHQFLPSAKVILFGSRLKGTATNTSDCDIVIANKETIPLETLSFLKEAFDMSDLPFPIDLIDWNRISAHFQNHIDQYSQQL